MVAKMARASLREAKNIIEGYPAVRGGPQKLASKRDAMRALLWEPKWTMEVATAPIFLPELLPECLQSCGWSKFSQPRECCTRCGMYSRGFWKKTSNVSRVESAIGEWGEYGAEGKIQPRRTFKMLTKGLPSVPYRMWNETGSRFYWEHERGEPNGACELQTFSPITVCRSVCGKSCQARCTKSNGGGSLCDATLLAIGDSTLRGQIASLAHRVGQEGELTASNHRGCSVVTCNDPTTETTIRLNIIPVQFMNLMSLTQEITRFLKPTCGSADRSTPSADSHGGLVGTLRHADVLVVNTGPWDCSAWSRNGTSQNWKRIKDKAVGVIDALVQYQFHGRLVFRTTARGHPYCWEPAYRQPFLNPKELSDVWLRLRNLAAPHLSGSAYAEATIDKYVRDVGSIWRWEYMPLINRLFAAEVSELAAQHGIEFILQDASRLVELYPSGHMAELVSRADGEAKAINGDCLHYKHPSVNDWLNAHLLQSLADVQ
jgi:hypothetical protein